MRHSRLVFHLCVRASRSIRSEDYPTLCIELDVDYRTRGVGGRVQTCDDVIGTEHADRNVNVVASFDAERTNCQANMPNASVSLLDNIPSGVVDSAAT